MHYYYIPQALHWKNNFNQQTSLTHWKAVGLNIILLGDNAGMAEAVKEFGWQHIPQLRMADQPL